MTKRLLLAILVVLSLSASGCCGNRGLCRRMFNHSDGCYCGNQPMCNCGCNSCRCSPYSTAGCSVNSSYMGVCPNCQGGMCSSCGGGYSQMGSGGSAMVSAEMGGEVVEEAGYMPSDGGAMEMVGTPGCNCGAQ